MKSNPTSQLVGETQKYQRRKHTKYEHKYDYINDENGNSWVLGCCAGETEETGVDKVEHFSWYPIYLLLTRLYFDLFSIQTEPEKWKINYQLKDNTHTLLTKAGEKSNKMFPLAQIPVGETMKTRFERSGWTLKYIVSVVVFKSGGGKAELRLMINPFPESRTRM